MVELTVDPAGLHGLADRCRMWSDGPGEPAMPAASMPGLRTAVAVAEAQSAVDAVAQALATRMRQTAAALADAACAYRATEADSATALCQQAEAS